MRSMEIDAQMTQILELSDKNFKRALIMYKDTKENKHKE